MTTSEPCQRVLRLLICLRLRVPSEVTTVKRIMSTRLDAKSLIEREDEVTYRAKLFARLARGILPASSEEAGGYFRAGLDQMGVAAYRI